MLTRSSEPVGDVAGLGICNVTVERKHKTSLDAHLKDEEKVAAIEQKIHDFSNLMEHNTRKKVL